MDLQRLWAESQAQTALSGLQRVDLLKAIEAQTRQLFQEHPAFREGREALGTSAGQVSRCQDILVCQSTFLALTEQLRYN